MSGIAYDYGAQPKVPVVACLVCGEPTGDYRTRWVTERYGWTVPVARCACGFQYLAEQLTPDGYAEFYRTWYRALRPEGPKMSAKRKAFGEHLAAKCPEAVGLDSLLDAGGATGDVSAAFGARCVDVVDPGNGDPPLEELWEHPREAPPQWNVVLCLRTIDHCYDPLEALLMLHAVTRDYLLIDAVPESRWWVKIDHPCYWTETTLRDALARTGWTVTRAVTKEVLLCQPS